MHELTDERLAELRTIASNVGVEFDCGRVDDDNTDTVAEWMAGCSDDPEAPAAGRLWAVYAPTDEREGLTISAITGDGENAQNYAEHIAAFDPPTVLSLLDENDRLREEMDGMVPKDWHGLMAILEDIYPEGIFPTMADDPERDAGPRIVSLIRVVDELRWRLDAVEAMHAPLVVRYGDAPDELACRACGTHYEYPVAWPCPTVKAASGVA